MELITINKQSCIECGKCVRVCPSQVLIPAKGSKAIEVVNINYCTSCGHCVAICPTDAVEHTHFPASKVHAFDPKDLPSPDAVELLIRSRRSNRAFSPQPVPGEMLERILEAAYRAPTASNEQELEFTLVTDPNMLRQISVVTMDVFNGILKLLTPVKGLISRLSPEMKELIPQFEEMRDDFNGGKDEILRGATAVLFIHTYKGARFGKQDSNLAYQNASLMAESLGIAQFYTGFVCVAASMDLKKRLEKLLGIKGEIHAGLALGVPSFRFNKYVDRKPMKVTRI